MTVVMNAGQMFREARESKGISQKALYIKTGVTPGDISRFENGANISLVTIERLARGIGMKASVVFAPCG